MIAPLFYVEVNGSNLRVAVDGVERVLSFAAARVVRAFSEEEACQRAMAAVRLEVIESAMNASQDPPRIWINEAHRLKKKLLLRKPKGVLLFPEGEEPHQRQPSHEGPTGVSPTGVRS